MSSQGGRINSLLHVFRRAGLSLWENLYLNLVATGVIATAMLLAGVFLTVQYNVNQLVDNWESDVHISAYFDPDVSDDRRFELREQVARDPRVASVRYISSADAEEWLLSRLDGMENILDDLGGSVLPASLEVSLTEAHGTPASIQSFVAALGTPEFTKIDYGLEWVQRFNTFLGMLKLLGAILGLLILIAALFLVSNTVDLVMYNRRVEIEIQRYVGATNGYITGPFVIEGIVQGTLGACISLTGLWGVHKLLVLRLQEALNLEIAGTMYFLPQSYLVAIFAAGVVLGVGAGSISVRRFLAKAA